MTDELATHYFKTWLHTDLGDFFELLRHINCRSMATMIDNVKEKHVQKIPLGNKSMNIAKPGMIKKHKGNQY